MYFYENTASSFLAVCPKKGGRLRKIEVPNNSVPKYEVGDTVADIQQRREEREARERKEAQQQGRRWQRAGGRSGGITLARGGSYRKKAQDRKT